MHFQFLEDGFDMAFYRIRRDHQGLGNFFIGHSFGQQIKNFPLTFSQSFQLREVLPRKTGFIDQPEEGIPVKSLLFEVSKDRLFGIRPLDLIHRSYAAHNDRGDACRFGTG